MMAAKPPFARRFSGPDDTASQTGEDTQSLPWNYRASVNPPLDCMNMGRVDWFKSHSPPDRRSATNRREIGVDHGDIAAADQFHQRRDFTWLARSG